MKRRIVHYQLSAVVTTTSGGRPACMTNQIWALLCTAPPSPVPGFPSLVVPSLSPSPALALDSLNCHGGAPAERSFCRHGGLKNTVLLVVVCGGCEETRRRVVLTSRV